MIFYIIRYNKVIKVTKDAKGYHWPVQEKPC